MSNIEPLQVADNVLTSFDSVRDALEHFRAEWEYCDREYNDLTHALELTSFNASQGFKLAKQIKDNRTRRRYAKDMVELLEPLADAFKRHRGLYNDIKKAHAEIERTKGVQMKRTYRPREREDLFERLAKE